VHQDFELYVHLVRLNLWERNLGQPALRWLPCGYGGAILSSSRGQFFEGEFAMRSDLVFGALSHVSNRYQLCQLASKATRKLHKPNTRLQDTANEVLARFQTSNPGYAVPYEATAQQPVETRRAA
jgi:hypothetical protein